MEKSLGGGEGRRLRLDAKIVSGFRLGNVSYHMLLECLRDHEILHAPETYAKPFTWYATLTGGEHALRDGLHAGTLVLCHGDIAREVLDAHPDCFCVVMAQEGEGFSWAQEKRRRGRVLVVRQIERFYHYDSLLQRLFVNDLVWENEMDRVVYSRGRLDKLIAVSEGILGNFVCITDTGYNLIAYSRTVEPPRGGYSQLVSTNCYSKGAIEDIERKVLGVVRANSRLVVCDPAGDFPYPVLHYPIFINGAYLFHVAMPCCCGTLACLKDLFLKFVRRVEALCNDFWKTTVNLESSCHRVLIGLLDGESMTDEYREIQLARTAIPQAKQFRLVRFRFDASMPYRDRLQVVDAAKGLNGGACYPFVYEEDLLVLYYTDQVCDAALSGRMLYADVQRTVFEPYGIAASASQAFYAIGDLQLAYREACIAWAMRAPMEKECASLFGDPAAPCYAFEHALKYYLLSESCDADLVAFAFDNSILSLLANEDEQAGTNIVQMIWVYLNNERNATVTSKLVHVHRNTVLYHIARVEKRFDISFDSPLLRSRIILDYQRLLLEGRVR